MSSFHYGRDLEEPGENPAVSRGHGCPRPSVERGNDLIAKIRSLTAGAAPPGRRYLGERTAGPTYVIEAVGGTRFPLPPSVESPLDMTGVEALQQAWTVVRDSGHVRTCSIGHPMVGKIFPTAQMKEALQAAADRVAITAVIDFA
jgi:hypothetical protein